VRVIHATDYGSPYAGAFVPMLDVALARVRERGWQPLATLPARAQQRDWLPALAADRPAGELLIAPDRSRRELGRWLTELVDADPQPTLIHAHWSIYDLAAARLARRPNVKTIWHFHTVLGDEPLVRARNRLRFLVAGRHVERMLCVAPHLAEAIVARGAPRAKVRYFPNAVDVARFPGEVGADERTRARAELGLDPDATVLLHIGRDWQLKGGDLFLDALELLRRDRDVVGLMVRGGDAARAEVVARGLEGAVAVVEGIADVRRFHAASDLMLATSRGEGMPFAVLESLASGLGVVATDIPGHTLPDGGPASLRIAPLAGDAIAAAAAALLDRDADTRRREGLAAHAWVRDELGLAAWGDRLMDVYDAVVDGSDAA
jgi:glycosyltransferase involved in cell wall biosynthesis